MSSIIKHWLKKGILIAILSISQAPLSYAGWEVTWIDKFDGTGVNLDNWTPQIDANFNNELQCYTDDETSAQRNFEISDGTLKIIARKQNISCPGLDGQNREWTSGRLNSKDKGEFLYGRIEARIRFSNLEGGTWPAFWMLENRIGQSPIKGDNDTINWPNPGAGEIDVWEWFSNDGDSYITNFFNAGNCGSLGIVPYPGKAPDVKSFHTYAMEWTADNIKFFFNDDVVSQTDISNCAQYKEPMFILLNVAMGGLLGGDIDPQLTGATMEIDYVAHCAQSDLSDFQECNESTPTQSDQDNDGVRDDLDLCPNTLQGAEVSLNGCEFITQPPTAAPDPQALSQQVISLFSDSYNNINDIDLNPDWQQATVVTQVEIAGNNTLRYGGLDYQGTDFDNNKQDVSAMDMVHIDYWTNNATELSFFIISPGPQETPYVIDVQLQEWISLDIPLSTFTDVDLSNLFQLKVTGNGTVYFDNIYFSRFDDLPLDTDSDSIPDNIDTDDDGDTIPDVYEITNGLDPLNSADALLDPDTDGLTNAQEYRLGTDMGESDTDNDGIADNLDNYPLDFDEVAADLYSGQFYVLTDMTEDGVMEFGVLSVEVQTSKVKLEIFNGKTNATLKIILWDDNYVDASMSLHILPDMNENDISEVGLFGIRDSENNPGKPQMFIRDLSSGLRVSVLNWLANWKEVSVKVLPDMTGDSLNEVAIQGRFKEGNRPQLVIKNGLTNASVSTFGYPDLFLDPVFYAHSDVNGDGYAEISTFGRIASNNKLQVKVANGLNASDRLKAYNFPDKWNNVSWQRLDDSNDDGIKDWGLFGINKDDNRPQLIVKDGTDPKGALRIHAWPAEMQNAQFYRIPDMNNDAVDEVAVSGRRSNNNRYQFQVQDGTDRNNVLANHNLDLPLEDLSFHVLPDLTQDDKAEIGFLGVNKSGEYELVIRDGDTHPDSGKGELSSYNLGSDWSSTPSIISLGDADDDGLPDLLIYGQNASEDRLKINQL
jgi:beta-glucanase (GH16 family)